MPSVLIVSPDPQTKRMFQLGLELEGLCVQTASGLEGMGRGDRFDAILLDAAEDSDELWKMLRALSAKAKSAPATSTVLLLPRGEKPSGAPRGIRADFVVRRPFELLSAIQMIRALAEGKAPAPERQRPAKGRGAGKHLSARSKKGHF